MVTELAAAVLCTVFGFAVPVIIVFGLIRRASSQMATAAAYRDLGVLLGLESDTRGRSVSGVLMGRVLWVGEVLVHSEDTRRTEIHGYLGFTRPLGQGINIRPRKRRTVGVPFGIASLDKALLLTHQSEFAGDCIRNAKVLQALESLVERVDDLRIHDEHIRVKVRRPPRTIEALERLVSDLERLAEALELSSLEVPATEMLADWGVCVRELADHYGLPEPDRGLRLVGERDGIQLDVCPYWDREQWRGWVRVRFGVAASSPFHIESRGPDHRDRAGQDILIDDPAFDDAFAVKGYDPDSIRRKLTPEVCSRLMTLAQRCDVALNSYQLLCRRCELGDLAEVIRISLWLASQGPSDFESVSVIDV